MCADSIPRCCSPMSPHSHRVCEVCLLLVPCVDWLLRTIVPHLQPTVGFSTLVASIASLPLTLASNQALQAAVSTVGVLFYFVVLRCACQHIHSLLSCTRLSSVPGCFLRQPHQRTRNPSTFIGSAATAAACNETFPGCPALSFARPPSDVVLCRILTPYFDFQEAMDIRQVERCLKPTAERCAVEWLGRCFPRGLSTSAEQQRRADSVEQPSYSLSTAVFIQLEQQFIREERLMSKRGTVSSNSPRHAFNEHVAYQADNRIQLRASAWINPTES